MPAGLYIHIPFCLHKCPYCDFYSVPFNKELAQKFVEALKKETSQSSVIQPWSETIFSTLYVGGGTPTSLSIYQLEDILDHCLRRFRFEEDVECTIEANPETIDDEKLRTLSESGINRLSLGVQSFRDEELKRLGRIHSVRRAIDIYHQAREVGFQNIGMDLIFAIPGQSRESWEQTLRIAVDLAPEHISTYGLTIEYGTQFAEDVKRGTISRSPEDLEADMYDFAIDLLELNGYEHYEISNFARPGFRSQHNMLYWNHAPYLGLGPSAHAFHTNRRTERTRDVHTYIERIERGESSGAGEEMLSKKKLMAEVIFLGLRKREGLNLNLFRKRFGIDVEELHGESIKKYTDLKMLERKGSFLQLTRKGLMVANTICSDFM